MDTFSQSLVTPNSQVKNANAIMTSERINDSDAMAETLKGLTINDTGYYNSDKNDAEVNPEINPKVATHTNNR